MRKIFFLFVLCSLFMHADLSAQVRVPFTMDSNIFYGAYVNTYGKYNYDWEDGQIRMSSDGLLNEGCGFCWDDRYFTVEIEGVPDVVSFSTSTSFASTALGGTDWVMEESSDGSTWHELWNSSSQKNQVSKELSKNTRYVRVHYGFNYSGYVKDFTITACHYVKFRSEGEVIATQGPFRSGESLSTVQAPTPTLDCHDFVGWDKALPAEMGGADIVLDAQFARKTYNVTLRLAGDSYEVPLRDTVLSLACGSTFSYEAPSAEGFTFGGWSPELPAVVSEEVDGNTYSALWTRNVYALNYIDGTDTTAVRVAYGDSVPEMMVPAKEGYTFIQWDPTVPERMPSHDVTVSAQWKVNMHQLSLHLFGDSVWTDSLAYGSVIVPSIPSRRGYTFDGWDALPEVMPDRDVDAWARWIQDEYRFSAVAAGDTLFSAPYHMGDTIQLPDTFTVYGYSIVEWEPSLPDVMPDSDWTVTAVLKANSHLLTVQVDSVVTYSEQVDFATPIEMDLLVPADSAGVVFEWISEPIVMMPDSDVVLLGKYVNQRYPLKIYDDEWTWVDTLCPYGDSVLLHAPEKKGFHLTNWGDVPIIMPASPVEVRLGWEKNIYAISLDVEGDTLWTDSVAFADAIPYPVFPDSIGYRLYWEAELPVEMPDSDLHVHGYWDEYKWLFSLADRGDVLLSVYYRPGDTISGVESPVREGYTFDGWSPEIPVLMPDSDFSAVARWEKNTYPFRILLEEETVIDTVYYYEDTIVLPHFPERVGHTLVQDTCPARMPAHPVELSYTWSVNHHHLVLMDGEEILLDSLYGYGDLLPNEDLSRMGYTFAGWSPELPLSMPDSDLVSVALWRINHYKLVVSVDGDTMDIPYAYDDVVFALDAQEKTGCRFDWLDTFPVRMPAEDVSVRGHYSPLSYPFVALVDGDTLVSADYLFGTAIEAPATPEKEGYTFEGWGDTVPAYMPAHPLRLEAVWKANKYQLQFMDGDSVVLDTSIVFGGALPQFPELVKEGYTFMGWDDSVVVMPSHEVEINALWKTNRYCITLMIVSATTMKMLELPRKVMFDFGEPVVFDDIEQGAYRFVKWNNECPETMPAKNFALIALVDEIEEDTGQPQWEEGTAFLTVIGNRIHLTNHPGNEAVVLYDMCGRVVFRGVTTVVEVPSPGVYILEVNRRSVKVLVR
ncbi:MAG: InlB B-repeat-containing protein [Paludibacteraceae bacterium]|nr:InlB B-repeat-containing protein [Paludibacteraceae bacterium]